MNGAFKSKQDTLKKYNFNLDYSEYFLNASSPKDHPVSELYGFIEDDDSLQLEEIVISKDLKAKEKDKLLRKRLAERQMMVFKFNETLEKVKDISSDVAPMFIPMFIIDFEKRNSVQFCLENDVVFRIQPNVMVKDLYKSTLFNLKKQLDGMKDMVLHFIDLDNTSLHIPQALHFKNQYTKNEILTLYYPKALNDVELSDYRSKMHELYSIPTDRPYLRKGNRLRLENMSDSNLLINPHIGLRRLFEDGKVSLVDGDYHYHHYMQDGIDDNGWGCAYRSLQTIISWFRNQGYIDIEKVPDHRKIQQTLVEIGDKEPSFVGTRKWIGSQEVGYVLDQLYDIVSKTMFVSAGHELASKGSELRNHFLTQGTPIMIGGGVLAHTILGVDFNEKTGDIAFLILDPHYTGSEDLEIVQKKGWCGWKLPDFWQPNSFYNLCLPQRPLCF